MKLIKFVVTVLLFTLGIFATETKKISKEFETSPGQTIELNGVSAMNVKMISWDKDLVKIDLKVKVKSNDKDYEKEYIEAFSIEEWSTTSKLQIDLNETDDEGGWSFLDIFSLKFNFSIEKEIVGEIYLPAQNSLIANIRYSTIELNDMQKEVQLIGRGNEIKLNNCKNLSKIENRYGTTFVSNCGGKLELESRSSELEIVNHTGDLYLKTDYCNSVIDRVEGNLVMESRSANIVIKNINGDAEIITAYSEMTVENIRGMAKINNRSGQLKLTNAGGLKFVGSYAPLTLKGISGTASDLIYLETRSAEIMISEIQSNIKIDDSYSNFTFENIRGNVEIISRSGNINGKNIVGNWLSDTKYSNIILRELNAEKINIKNASGKIELADRIIPKRVLIENQYEDVTLELPKGFNGNVNLETKHGEIRSDIPVRINAGSNKVNASKGSGTSEPFIKIRNRSGNIVIKELASAD